MAKPVIGVEHKLNLCLHIERKLGVKNIPKEQRFMPIFETDSKVGKKVRLTEAQWAHIRSKHKELDRQIQQMILTIKEPNFIYRSLREDNYYYYKWFEQTPVTAKYLLVIVKHLNKEGFIITAFFVSSVRKEGKEVVYGKENLNKL